jgi:very-short-patch-repair endonuclease
MQYHSLARQLRKNATEAERWLWQHLRLRQMGQFKFRRQHPIGRYIVDFICIEAKLIVEIDGGQHNEVDGCQSDAVRTAWLEKQGFKVLRFWNDEVLTDVIAVNEVIWNELMILEEVPPP